MSKELENCPFCGEAYEIVKNKSFFQFQCVQGCIESATYDTPEDAADACNTRAEAQKVEPTDKQLQAMCWAFEEATGQRLPDGEGYDFEICRKMLKAAQGQV